MHDPGNTASIDTLYAFLSEDAQGRHGIVAHVMPDLGSTPLITGSARVAELMKPLAAKVAAQSGKEIAMHVFQRGAKVWSTRA